MKTTCSVVILLGAFIPVLSAQETLPISVEIQEPLLIEGTGGLFEAINTGADYGGAEAQIVRRISASVPSLTEAWVPLGVFRNGAIHKLVINSTGGGSNSGLTAEFVAPFNGDAPKFYSLSQHSANSQFQLHFYPHGKNIGLAIKFNNSNANNTNVVSAVHFSSQASLWREHTPSILESQLTSLSLEEQDALRVVAGIEQYTVHPTQTITYGHTEGISINTPLTVSSTLVIPPGGNVSMGEFGE